MIRIFAGNVDLKATFKTVAIKDEMTVKDVLDAALKKFRVADNGLGEYYLSILHLDSAEKKLPIDGKLLSILDTLKHKALPGAGGTSGTALLLKNEKGNDIRLQDDNIVKILVNKKLNLFEKNYHLVRVHLVDEVDEASNSVKLYKTIGLNSNQTMQDVISFSIRKFKIPNPDHYQFTILSVFKGHGKSIHIELCIPRRS